MPAGRPPNPYIGDIHLLFDAWGPEGPKYDARGFPDTDKFEVWDGREWVHAKDGMNRIYKIQLGDEPVDLPNFGLNVFRIGRKWQRKGEIKL